MTQLIGKFFKLLLVVYVFFFAFMWWRPIPEVLTHPTQTYHVSDKSVRFYSDLEYIDKKGVLLETNTIVTRYRELIKNAQHSVLAGAYRIPPQVVASGTQNLTNILESKHAESKHVAMAVVTDPINTLYGGLPSESMEQLRKNGVFVVQTDMNAMPDGNLLYTSFWRPFISWWGNSINGGWLVSPIEANGAKVTLRSWLSFLNTKANESKFLITDAVDTKSKNGNAKLISYILSSDLADPLGASGKVALEVDDGLWKDLLARQGAIGDIASAPLPSFAITNINPEQGGALKVSLLGVATTRETLITKIEGLHPHDHLDITSRFISDRDIISALKSAAGRNVIIRIVLDPNDSLFNFQLLGMPNLPVGKELSDSASGGIEVRYCDAHALPCTSRLIVGRSASSTFLVLGSADLTRKDTAGFNIESVVLVEAPSDFTAAKDATVYFNKIWNNEGGVYTVDYNVRADQTLWKSSVYRIMERTGITLY